MLGGRFTQRSKIVQRVFKRSDADESTPVPFCFGAGRPVIKLRANMAEALIELQNVDVALNGTTVLHDVTWSLHRGEHWIIRGANGSGKSTFLRLLRGEVWPTPNRGIRIYRLDGST